MQLIFHNMFTFLFFALFFHTTSTNLYLLLLYFIVVVIFVFVVIVMFTFRCSTYHFLLFWRFGSAKVLCWFNLCTVAISSAAAGFRIVFTITFDSFYARPIANGRQYFNKCALNTNDTQAGYSLARSELVESGWWKLFEGNVSRLSSK